MAGNPLPVFDALVTWLSGCSHVPSKKQIADVHAALRSAYDAEAKAVMAPARGSKARSASSTASSNQHNDEFSAR